MARDIGKRLGQLRTRRSGLDRIDKINDQIALDEVLRKGSQQEAWQTRAVNKPYTRYALGAMQAVDAEYTRISVETAQRVANQLEGQLPQMGHSVAFRLQGSVALDVHIRGVSDVDLLTLETSFYTYSTVGRRSLAGFYAGPPSLRTSIGVLTELRKNAEQILKSSFPKADVDISGGKAIALSGGSLARPVDIVPSHYFDSLVYQETGQDHDRGVTILNTKVPETIDNWPFLHIKLIDDLDATVGGTLKKAIRLCKNVRSDAESEGTSISFPSFDMAATMYHADRQALSAGRFYELAVLSETQRHLDYLARDMQFARTLPVPDGSRKIFDTDEKLKGLVKLSIEMDDLLRQVAKEQNSFLAALDEPPLDASRNAISALDAANI